MYETRNRADNVISNSNGDEIGPVLSGIYDTQTGKKFFAQNFTGDEIRSGVYDKFVENSHPILKRRIKELQAKIKSGEINQSDPKYARLSEPGSHSEIKALDEALKYRQNMGFTITESDLSDFILHNRSLDEKLLLRGGVPHRCLYCNYITKGLSVIGND